VTRRLAGLIFLLCLALAAAPAAAERFYGTVNVPSADYPPDARPGERPLSARLRFALGPNGSVVRCVVTQSSGVEALDAASCRILQERARFRPERGRSTSIVQFTWGNNAGRGRSNPRGAPLPFAFVELLSANDYPADAIRGRMQGGVDYETDVSVNGVALACRVVGSSGAETLDRRTCQLVMARDIYIPASDGQGGRRAATYNGRLTWRLP